MRRFGVSLPKEVADVLDRLSRELGVTRSQVVLEALQNYIAHAKAHGADGHTCFGVALALAQDLGSVEDLLEQFRKIIVNYSHIHMDDRCLLILVLKGSGEEVARLSAQMAHRAETYRYIPLDQ